MNKHDRSGNHCDRTHDGHKHAEAKKPASVLIPFFRAREDEDSVRTRHARAAFVLEMFSLNPKGFRERAKRNPLDMTYVDSVHVWAGLTTAPELERSKRGKQKFKLLQEFKAKFKANPNQHRSNWQANHKGELRNDSVARMAAV